MFFIESTDEQWPTSNGIHTKICTWHCKCEPLDNDRIAGKGALIDHSKHNRNISGDLSIHLDAQQNEKLQTFYGRYFPHLVNVSDYSISVPSYLHANWRNDISHSILLQSAPHIKIVPVWKQLVAQSMPHSRNDGDCTHKSLDAVIAIVEQLTRTMMLI